MKIALFSFVLFAICYLLFTIPVNADVSSQPIYGGGQMTASNGRFTIDKKVANPQSQNTWADNLNIDDPKYQPDSAINFQINLTNTGNTEIKQINIKDIFPQYVNFISGPASQAGGPGNFDPNTKTLSFDVNDLKPKENRTFTVVGKVVSANQLPIDIGTLCMTNQVTASSTDSGMSQDNALFCVQKEVLGKHQTAPPKGGFPIYPPQDITVTPATGPETFLLFSLLPAGIAGWLLRRYS